MAQTINTADSLSKALDPSNRQTYREFCLLEERNSDTYRYLTKALDGNYTLRLNNTEDREIHQVELLQTQGLDSFYDDLIKTLQSLKLTPSYSEPYLKVLSSEYTCNTSESLFTMNAHLLKYQVHISLIQLNFFGTAEFYPKCNSTMQVSICCI
jgi:hypothetical protein